LAASALGDTEELSFLRGALDPELAPALSAGEAAPRLALASALYSLAGRLGLRLLDSPAPVGAAAAAASDGGAGEDESEFEAGAEDAAAYAPKAVADGAAGDNDAAWQSEAREAGAAFWTGLLRVRRAPGAQGRLVSAESERAFAYSVRPVPPVLLP
jgi:hypothetical protein